MKLAAYVLAIASLSACRGSNAPSTPSGAEGETCKIAERVTRECAAPLTCKPRPYQAPQDAGPGPHGPEQPSDVGGACGGVAGFHCAEGLECDMTPEQERVADGMGSCARSSQCAR